MRWAAASRRNAGRAGAAGEKRPENREVAGGVNAANALSQPAGGAGPRRFGPGQVPASPGIAFFAHLDAH